MARKKPLRLLKLTDVRWSKRNSARIVAAPAWAYDWPYPDARLKWPIEHAWKPIYKTVRARLDERERQQAEHKEWAMKTAIDPNASEVDKLRASVFISMSRHTPKRTYAVGPGRYPDGSWRALRKCKVCGAKFYGQGSITACTDACAKIQRDRTRTRGNPKPRRVQHEPRECRECRMEFTPRRKDAEFCSTKCRVTSFRLRKRSEEHPV